MHCNKERPLITPHSMVTSLLWNIMVSPLVIGYVILLPTPLGIFVLLVHNKNPFIIFLQRVVHLYNKWMNAFKQILKSLKQLFHMNIWCFYHLVLCSELQQFFCLSAGSSVDGHYREGSCFANALLFS